MKYPFLSTILFAFVFNSCSGEDQTQTDYADPLVHEEGAYSDFQGQDAYNGQTNSQGEAQGMNSVSTGEQKSSGQKAWIPVKDPKSGMIASHFYLPSTWKFKQPSQEDQSNLVGPRGVKGYTYPGKTYMYSDDAYMQQSYQMAGQQMRRPIGVRALADQEFIPMVQKEGMTVVKKYELPELAEYDRQYNSQLYGSQNMQSSFSAYAIEWKDKKGNPSITILRYREDRMQGFMSWGYHCNAFEAEPSHYEQAKSDFIYSISHVRNNPEQIAQFNARERAKEQQSWSQHNQRMAANQRAFDASQEQYKSGQSVSDIMMDGWKKRNDIQDQGHSNYINGIHEQVTVTDPNNGQSYNVDAGANQTWMNGNGEYIQSDDYFYDPNMDPNVDHNNWQQAGEDDY